MGFIFVGSFCLVSCLFYFSKRHAILGFQGWLDSPHWFYFWVDVCRPGVGLLLALIFLHPFFFHRKCLYCSWAYIFITELRILFSSVFPVFKVTVISQALCLLPQNGAFGSCVKNLTRFPMDYPCMSRLDDESGVSLSGIWKGSESSDYKLLLGSYLGELCLDLVLSHLWQLTAT